jgi:hypothetical protein
MSRSKVAIMNERRQKAAAAYDVMDNVIAEHKKIFQYANFEETTSKKIEKRMHDVCFF